MVAGQQDTARNPTIIFILLNYINQQETIS